MKWLISLFAIAALAHSVSADEFVAIEKNAATYLEKSGLPGAAVLIVSREEGVVYEEYFGTYDENTVVSIASAAKWLSGATLMTLVDAEKLSLDDLASEYVPDLDRGQKSKITIRQLFNHTSGFPDAAREKNAATTLTKSAENIAAVPLKFQPGTGFLYGGGAMQMAGRVAEVAENDWPWVAIFAKRIAEPLQMENTVYTSELNENPKIAGGVRTTLSDYGNLLTMLLNEGKFEGERVLSQGSVAELLTDRTRAAIEEQEDFTVHGFAAARRGDFDGYGVGCWIDVKEDGQTVMASSPGAFGFNPWIDLKAGYAAIWMIEDRERARHRMTGLPNMREIITQMMTK